MKLNVIYRACSIGNPTKHRPIENRPELLKTCFESFLHAFRNVDYDLTILLDKPDNYYRNLYEGHTVEEAYYSNFNEGNTKSFHRQLDLALEGERPFLLVEDDYYFVPHAGDILSKCTLPFYTPYLHPDYFTLDIHNEKKEVIDHNNTCWMSVSATTLTFGGQHDALVKEYDTMKKYGWADYPMWCDVTQREKLYTPIPTLATHMETGMLSPFTVWPFMS